MNVAILILAAGGSSRMGKAKQLLPVQHTTLLGVAIENAQKSNAKQLYCVLGEHAEQIQETIEKYSINIIHNPNYKNGLSSSIVKGIKHLKSKPIDAILVMLADQPKVDTSYLNALIDSFYNHSSKISASNYSGIYGVPAIFPKKYIEKLLNLKGDKGAKDLLNSKKEQVISLTSDKLIDIDTQDEYLSFLKSL